MTWKDVHLWAKHVTDWSSDNLAKQEAIRSEGWTLLRGQALQWVNQQLSDEETRALKVSYTTFVKGVVKQFGIRPEEAGEWLTKRTYTLEINQKDESIRTFAMELFNYYLDYIEHYTRSYLKEKQKALVNTLKASPNRSTATLLAEQGQKEDIAY
ncbi:hypothetical protein TruAng_011655 [Truncatella angustata]|nr:hypothetical protein TruAng_011655 [Truncatella angustata]